jgi:hypothetical protein
MSQAIKDISQEINGLKQSLSNHTKAQAYEFESLESLISVLRVNDQQIKFYWDTDQPRIILSSSYGDRLIELHDVEGLPKECLSNREYLSAYLAQTRVQLTHYNNNEGFRLRFNLKLLGGANIIDPDKAPERLWPNAIIPIFVDCSSFNRSELKTILSAVNDWAENTEFLFKVHFRGISKNDAELICRYTDTSNLEVSCSINTVCSVHKQFESILLNDNENGEIVSLKKEPAYLDSILIQKYTPSCRVNPRREEADSCNVCQSFVGRQGGQQLISCKLGNSFGEDALKHELGHALGFYHEQQRPDRDQFVAAPNLDEYDPNYGKKFHGFFRKTFGEYDFKSIMHYFFGTGMIGTQAVGMNVKEKILIPQFRQLVELGAPGYTPSFNFVELNSRANRQRATAGIDRVGKSGRLSQTDIAAANYLASAAMEMSSSDDCASPEAYSARHSNFWR